MVQAHPCQCHLPRGSWHGAVVPNSATKCFYTTLLVHFIFLWLGSLPWPCCEACWKANSAPDDLSACGTANLPCEIARFGTDAAKQRLISSKIRRPADLGALLQETATVTRRWYSSPPVLFRRPHRRLRGPGLAPSSWQIHAISLRRAARESYISWRCPGRLDDSPIRFFPGDNSIPYSSCRDATQLPAIWCVSGVFLGLYVDLECGGGHGSANCCSQRCIHTYTGHAHLTITENLFP